MRWCFLSGILSVAILIPEFTVSAQPTDPLHPHSNRDSCPFGYFTCGDGGCITNDFICNGEADCLGAEDERNCPSEVKPKCLDNEFDCGDGLCISTTFHCDQIPDCLNGTDEKTCSLIKFESCPGFRCADASHCISSMQKCDGHHDCRDGSDELYCGYGMNLLAVFTGCKHGFRCDGHCMSSKFLCNGRVDCGDGSDESKEKCSHQACKQTCDHECDAEQSRCVCRLGYRLEGESKCVLEDPCVSKCSQSCSPATTLNDTICSCREGFSKGPDSCTLLNDQPQPILMYVSGNEIREMTERWGDKRRVLKPANPQSELISYDMDVLDGRVFAIVSRLGHRDRIYSSSERAPPREILQQFRSSRALRVIAVDWVTTNVYIDDGQDLSVCHADSGRCARISDDMRNLKELVLDPPRGRMFVYCSGTRWIRSVSMDGTSVKNLVALEADPVDLHLTYESFSDQLYWADDTDIRVYSLQSGKQYLVRRTDPVESILSLAVFDDHLVWSEHEMQKSSIKTANKRKQSDKAEVLFEHKSFSHLITAVKVFHPLKQQNVANPCWKSRCSHICLLTSDSRYACACPKYHKLVDKTECIPTGSTFFFTTSNALYSIAEKAVLANDTSVHDRSHHVGRSVSIAVDQEEDVVYALQDSLYPKIIKLNRKTLVMETLVTKNVDHATDITFDPFNRLIIWLETNKAAIYMYSVKTGGVSKFSVREVLGFPKSFAVDYRRGTIFVLYRYKETNSILRAYSFSGSKIPDHTTTIPMATRIAIDVRDAKLYVYRPEERSIVRYESVVPKGAELHAQIIANDVDPVRKLIAIDDGIAWTSVRKRGFYISSVDWFEPKLITRDDWTDEILALTLARQTAVPQTLISACAKAACSHVCVSSERNTTCLCDIGEEAINGKCQKRPPVKCDESLDFACKNTYQCVYKSQRCDMIPDCDDESDEEVHMCQTCPMGMMKCANNVGCYTTGEKCDGANDCSDGSDEKDCPPAKAPAPKCTSDQYTCALSGACIASSKRCDGKPDCRLRDDEEGCTTCPKDSFRCKSGSCKPAGDQCDGWKDCPDGDDEEQCEVNNCPQNMHFCDGSQCFGSSFVCDGVAHCNDGSDESGCAGSPNIVSIDNCKKSGGKLWCEGNCITEDKICDHYPDCLDGRDEAKCQEQRDHCSINQFQCANKKCVPIGVTCDLEDDCGDNSDETLDHCHKERELEHASSACHSDEFRCNDDTCIRQTLVCNGSPDCPDASDEGRHCPADECANHPCQHECHANPDGYRCGCRQGFRLETDHVSCVDINECEEETDNCSHYCINSKGSFECDCGMGFKSVGTNSSECVPEDANPILAYVESNHVAIQSRRYANTVAVSGVHHKLISGLTCDVIGQNIYYSDASSIWKVHMADPMKPGEPEEVVKNLISPRDLAFDWISKKMYFIEASNRIIACDLSFRFCTRIPTPPIDHIRSLALAANEGRLFYSYWDSDRQNFSNGGIIKSAMDGSEPVLITKDITMRPTHLQVEFVHRKIYFYDLKLQALESMNFDSTHRKVLLHKHLIDSLAIYPDYLFWSEHGDLHKANWRTPLDVKVIHRNHHGTFLNVIHATRQLTEKNHCDGDKCEQLCLITPRGYACACDARYELTSDNRTCVASAHQEELFGVACDPECEEDKICVMGRDRNYCACRNGNAGAVCDIVPGLTSSSLIVGLWLVLALALSAGGAFVYYKKHSLTDRFSMLQRQAYRAQDMKNLVDDEEQQPDDLRTPETGPENEQVEPQEQPAFDPWVPQTQPQQHIVIPQLSNLIDM